MQVADVEALILRERFVDATRADGAQDTLLVRVHTDEGIVGIGEVDSSPEVAAGAIQAPASSAVASGLGRLLVGCDPRDSQDVWDRLYRGSIYAGRRGAVIHALSGIDMALWDIRGKAAGMPVSALLGTPRLSHIRVYASVLMPEREEQVRTMVSSIVDQGFTAVKLGWGPLGDNPWHDAALATAAREAAGPEVDLMLDAGCGYGKVTDASIVADALSDLGYTWFEEPFDADRLDLYRALRDRSQVLIAGGEQYAPGVEFRQAVESEALDVLQPDLARCGGFTEGQHIANLAEENRLWCVPHAWKTGVLKAASLHWNAVLPGDRLQEWSVADNDLARHLVATDMPVVRGTAEVPTGPGLGIEIDQSIVERFVVR